MKCSFTFAQLEAAPFYYYGYSRVNTRIKAVSKRGISDYFYDESTTSIPLGWSTQYKAPGIDLSGVMLSGNVIARRNTYNYPGPHAYQSGEVVVNAPIEGGGTHSIRMKLLTGLGGDTAITANWLTTIGLTSDIEIYNIADDELDALTVFYAT